MRWSRPVTATDSPADLVRRFLRLCSAAALASETRAGSLEERVSCSKPGSSHLTFGDDQPLGVRLLRSFANWLAMWEREVEGRYPQRLPDHDRSSAARKAQTQAILTEVGKHPLDLCSAYWVAPDYVEGLRSRRGLDPLTGERKTVTGRGQIDGRPIHRPTLTAPAHVAQERLEERHADGEVIA